MNGENFRTSSIGGVVIFTLEKEEQVAYKVYTSSPYPSEEYFPMLSIINDETFEPYRTPQTVTLTSDRPLTKWDRLEKRSGQWGWVYKSGEIVLDGSGDERTRWNAYNNEIEGMSFYIGIIDAKIGYGTSLCEKYRNVEGSWNEKHRDIKNIYSDHSSTNSRYFRPPNDEITSAIQWMEWLSNNPLTLIYERSETTFVPLSLAEQDLMDSLYTFRPTTVLSNDCECNMTLTYKTKKSLEVSE